MHVFDRALNLLGTLELVAAVIYASWSCFISSIDMLLDYSVDILVNCCLLLK